MESSHCMLCSNEIRLEHKAKNSQILRPRTITVSFFVSFYWLNQVPAPAPAQMQEEGNTHRTEYLTIALSTQSGVSRE